MPMTVSPQSDGSNLIEYRDRAVTLRLRIEADGTATVAEFDHRELRPQQISPYRDGPPISPHRMLDAQRVDDVDRECESCAEKRRREARRKRLAERN